MFNGTCRAGSDPAILPFAMEDQILVSCSKDEDSVIWTLCPFPSKLCWQIQRKLFGRPLCPSQYDPLILIALPDLLRLRRRRKWCRKVPQSSCRKLPWNDTVCAFWLVIECSTWVPNSIISVPGAMHKLIETLHSVCCSNGPSAHPSAHMQTLPWFQSSIVVWKEGLQITSSVAAMHFYLLVFAIMLFQSKPTWSWCYHLKTCLISLLLTPQ